MHLVELSHLPIGSPTHIAVAGVQPVQAGNLPEATRRIKARGEFVRERLIVYKPIAAGRADGLFIGSLRVELAALQPSNLGADQRRTILEIVRAIRCPGQELPVMHSDGSQALPALAGRRGTAEGRLRQRGVKVIFRCFQLWPRGPQ